MENDCSGNQMEVLDDVKPEDQKGKEETCADEVFETDMSAQIGEATEFTYSTDEDEVCLSRDIIPTNTAERDLELGAALDLKRKITGDEELNDEFWSDTSQFQESWLEDIDMYQSNLIDIEDVKKVKDWFEYVPNPLAMSTSKFRCRICRSYVEEFPSMNFKVL